ncbi:pilin protein [Pandoraea fibrosis]|uniref:Pilin protein n=1 Tax=Pandoraea fibrosis TaxID=1891094 RepID=A0ABX6HVY5_9BURK|nr:CfaE/CblD family pilus tip adhesin [Pandoraea fibrosis]QHE91777.1 pilin protein [Pandoraea fibrosis]QHF14665.1 pilin protein [Pandoraea fibrosis]
MRIIRSIVLMPLLAMALTLVSGGAEAEKLLPHDWEDKIEGAFERDSPAEVVIWNNKLAAEDASPEDNDLKRNYWVCHSDTDDQYGACATKGAWNAPAGPTVKLRFTEVGSRATYSLELAAFKNTGSELNALHGAMSTNGIAWVKIDVRIPSSELRKLPSGGIWKAHLKLKQMQWGTYKQVAKTEAEITLHVTDTKNVQIFLPEHSTTTPTVDLGLTGQVSRDGRTTGRRNIDMCLYDGFGSNSSYFDVTVKDGLSVPQREPSSFSVVRDGTTGQLLRERIDYGVTYLHNGQRKSLNNGETIRLPGGNNTEVRQVYLPNIPVPVMCKPMPLTLETPEFSAKEKSAGSYTGKLKIIFSPSAQSL